MFDVIVVGGSYAGLSAALQVARARRRVLVLDAGQRRNRFASHAHGFLGQDGQPPGAITARGRAELLAYPTAALREAEVTGARPVRDGFAVLAGGEEIECRRLILATGVVDELPPVPGLAERWGKTVFHCPYCHGYELGRAHLGVLGTGPMSAHHAALVSDWASELTLFLHGDFDFDAAQLEELASRGIEVEREPVVAVGGEAPEVHVRLRDGRERAVAGLFAASRTVVANPFARQLGCALEAGPLGDFYRTDAMKETTVPGVFACGDMAVAAGGVAFAVADGARAGISAHQSLVFLRG